MIQIYTDGILAYDSRLEPHDLISLKITMGLNVGGTATITLPRAHPAYDNFLSYKTIVTIYRDGVLRFRGRVLYPTEDFYGQRTITCEGELCLFGDGIHRPYSYKGTPAAIFAAVIQNYNEQMTNYDFKHFEVGEVTVAEGGSSAGGTINGTVNTNGGVLYIRSGPGTSYSIVGRLSPGSRITVRETKTVSGAEWGRIDKGWVAMQWVVLDPESDGRIQLESDQAETHLDVLDRLIERCGGYIVFSDAESGKRRINWYASLDRQNDQTIEFGENLLDFTRTGSNNTNFATTIIPYGAKDEKTKKRITIESVNGGQDYLSDLEAKAKYGNIVATQTWDDVTKPADLLKKAQAFLAQSKLFITSLELSALDLSYLDKDLDSFAVGDQIRVLSAPHGVDEIFQLTKMTEDLLHPAQSQIILGKDVPTLTNADVAGDSQAKRAVETATTEIKTEYTAETDKIAADVETKVLEQTAGIYVPQGDWAVLERRLTEEENNRKALIDLLNGALSVGHAAYPVHLYSSENFKFHKGATFEQGSVDFSNNNGIRSYNTDGKVYYTFRVDTANNCIVGNDYVNLYLRGKDAVYLHKTGAVVTSDRRHKNGIEGLPEAYERMLDKLEPVRFKYNGRGDKYHVGFVAQDVEQAMAEAGLTPQDFGGFVDLNGDGTELGLAYDEFIGLLLDKIRRLEKRIEILEG